MDAIVASGKTHEFLAQRELALRGAAERRLPNRERETNTFWVLDKRRPGEEPPLASPVFPPTTAAQLPPASQAATAITTTATTPTATPANPSLPPPPSAPPPPPLPISPALSP